MQVPSDAMNVVSIDELPNELLAACFAELSAVPLGRVSRTSKLWHFVAASQLARHEFTRTASMIAKLEDPHWEARQVAVERLCNSNSPSLALHAVTIVAKLEHANKDVRRAVVEVLETVEAATLVRHAAAIASKLDDSDPYVRKGLLQTLGSMQAGLGKTRTMLP